MRKVQNPDVAPGPLRVGWAVAAFDRWLLEMLEREITYNWG